MFLYLCCHNSIDEISISTSIGRYIDFLVIAMYLASLSNGVTVDFRFKINWGLMS